MLAQLLRVGPRNRTALPTHRVNHKICTIRAEIGFRAGIRILRQFAAAEKIRQAELLADRGAETVAGESPQFEDGCFANFTIDNGAGSQAQRATVQARIKQCVDLRNWQHRIMAIDRQLIPSGAWRSVRDKTDLVGR